MAKVNIVVVTPANFEKLRQDKVAKRAAIKELDLYGAKFTNAARLVSPVDKGATRNGLDWSVNNDGELKFFWNRPADRPRKLIEWLLYGTGERGPRKKPIVPKRGKFLQWRDKFGNYHRAKSVRGMFPRNFVKDAWDNTSTDRRKLAARVGRLIVDAMKDSRGGSAGPVVPTRK